MEAEVRREHADDDIGLTIEYQRPAEHAWVATKPALPRAITQDHHAVVPELFLFRRERTPQSRLDAQCPEEIPAHVQSRNTLRRPGRVRQIEAARQCVIGGNVFQNGSALLPDVNEVGDRCVVR